MLCPVDGLPARNGSIPSRPSSSRLPPQPPHVPSRLSQPSYPSTSSSSTRPAKSSSSRPPPVEEDWQHRNGKPPDRVPQEVPQADGPSSDGLELAEERMLDGVPLEVQEAWICEDLIFVLQVGSTSPSAHPSLIGLGATQGIEGSLIRYEEGYDPLDESQRIRGAPWVVDPSLGMPCMALGFPS